MEHPIYKHHITAHAFLQRAQAQLDRFDAGEVYRLFYAALELRFGIEARLYEYLRATYKNQGKSTASITEYVATRLLNKLSKADPNVESKVSLTVTDEQSGVSSRLEFTPVTRKLAQMHGRLGGLLHYTVFHKNPRWHFKPDLNGEFTLTECRRFLGEVAEELRQATAGRLLCHPQFNEMVREVQEE